MTKEQARSLIPKVGYAGVACAVLAGLGYFPSGGPIAGMCFFFAFGLYCGLEAEEN
jgi:hypothetical protein